MAGTGDGLLQPTKLIQTDDFLPAIAPLDITLSRAPPLRQLRVRACTEFPMG